MDVEIFPVQSSILSPDALLHEVNHRYGLKASICRLWSIGLNDVYLVQEKAIKYFLRISHAIRFTKKDYEEEINAILELREKDINTCIPVRMENNTYLWELNAPEGRRYAVLFHEVKDNKTVNTYNMGKMAAQIHKVSDELNIKCSRQPITKQQLIDQPLKRIKETNSMDKNETQFLEESSAQMWNDITSSIPNTAPYYGYCHGDMHSGNIYFKDNVPQIFDFDCMGMGYRAFDLCVYLWDETSVKEDFIQSAEWNEYLNGYKEIRMLSDDEIRLIPAFAALRQLWFLGLILDSTRINNSWDGIQERFFLRQRKRYQFWYEKWESSKNIETLYNA